MTALLKIAVAHSRISTDARENGPHIRALMREALGQGARLVHFPEGAASGYVKSQITNWDAVDWIALRDELAETAALAGELGIWTVVGCNHPLTPPNRPHNSLYVISDSGKLEGRYDKRLCSNTEIIDWYTPGFEPLVFEVDGLRFGCALCIEISFTGPFEDYRRRGVDCVLLSSYSNDPMDEVKTRAHAGLNNFWFSLAVPTNPRNLGHCGIYGPDGQIVAQTVAGTPSIATAVIDKSDDRWHVPLNLARPWREKARAGDIYEERRADDPRSRERLLF